MTLDHVIRGASLEELQALSDPSVLVGLESLHRSLRPELSSDYRAQMVRIIAAGGRMVVAERAHRVVGLALYRWVLTTRSENRFYLDDLVVADDVRRHGIGYSLLRYLEAIATEGGAVAVELESGLARRDSHRFYERAGYEQFAVSFRKALSAR